jgi:hypothetical protein
MVRPGDDPLPDDNDGDFVDEAMLADALAKARKLVAKMERQQAEVDASPPKLPPEQLAMGKFAFEKALASARRMLKALEDAAQIADHSQNCPDSHLNGPHEPN